MDCLLKQCSFWYHSHGLPSQTVFILYHSHGLPSQTVFIQYHSHGLPSQTVFVLVSLTWTANSETEHLHPHLPYLSSCPHQLITEPCCTTSNPRRCRHKSRCPAGATNWPVAHKVRHQWQQIYQVDRRQLLVCGAQTSYYSYFTLIFSICRPIALNISHNGSSCRRSHMRMPR